MDAAVDEIRKKNTGNEGRHLKVHDVDKTRRPRMYADDGN